MKPETSIYLEVAPNGKLYKKKAVPKAGSCEIDYFVYYSEVVAIDVIESLSNKLYLVDAHMYSIVKGL